MKELNFYQKEKKQYVSIINTYPLLSGKLIDTCGIDTFLSIVAISLKSSVTINQS